MRQWFFAVLILLSGSAAAQPNVSFGVGSDAASGDCHGVVQQIVQDWMDVRELMSSDSTLKRPSQNQFQCVAPDELKAAMQRHVGTSDLRCYTAQRVGVCCDAQMRSCAALSQ